MIRGHPIAELCKLAATIERNDASDDQSARVDLRVMIALTNLAKINCSGPGFFPGGTAREMNATNERL